MKPIMIGGKQKRVFINGHEYGRPGEVISNSSLVEFVLTAANVSEEGFLDGVVIELVNAIGNVITLSAGGREIRLPNGTYELTITCTGITSGPDVITETISISEDCTIEREFGVLVPLSWGSPVSLPFSGSMPSEPLLSYGGGVFTLRGMWLTYTIYTSTDAGMTWQAKSLPNTLSEPIGMVYGGDRWLLTYKRDDQCYTSMDNGNSWIAKQLPVVMIDPNNLPVFNGGCAFGRNTWVVMKAGNSGLCSISTNGGDTWALRALPVEGYWNYVIYAQGSFIAADFYDSKIVKSTDGGNTWTVGTSLLLSGTCNIAYGNGKFMAVSRQPPYLTMSIDGGNTWSIVTLPGWPSNIESRNVAYGGGIWVVTLGGVGNPDYCLISIDGGITWEQAYYNGSLRCNDIVYGDRRFIVAGNLPYPRMWCSELS